MKWRTSVFFLTLLTIVIHFLIDMITFSYGSILPVPAWPIRHSSAKYLFLKSARSFCNYNNILGNFGQLYSNSCFTTFSIATLGMCIACEFHQLWAVRPCIYHIFQHLTKWLMFCLTGHASKVCHKLSYARRIYKTLSKLLSTSFYEVFVSFRFEIDYTKLMIL